MKVRDYDSKTLTIEFSLDELKIITRSLEVPLSAFGLEKLLTRTNAPKEQISVLNQDLRKMLTENELVKQFKMDDAKLLSDAFSAANEIIDANEMQTLTSFTWEQALSVQSELKELVSSR